MKITLTSNNELTPRQLLDISQEALREVMISDLKYGAANGEGVFVRYDIPILGPTWFKVYTFKIGSNLYIDAQPITDEEVTACNHRAKDAHKDTSDVMPTAPHTQPSRNT